MTKHQNDRLSEEFAECLKVLRSLLRDRRYALFWEPVDQDELCLPDYYDSVQRPLDLSSIILKITQSTYHSFDYCFGDILLMFRNAVVFNNDNDVTETVKVCVADLTRRLFATEMLKSYASYLMDFSAYLAGRDNEIYL